MAAAIGAVFGAPEASEAKCMAIIKHNPETKKSRIEVIEVCSYHGF
jgi:hypothetical protein